MTISCSTISEDKASGFRVPGSGFRESIQSLSHVVYVLLVLLVLAPGCAPSSPGFAQSEFTGQTMGTTWTAKVAHAELVGGNPDPEQDRRLANAVQEALDGVNAMMSTYKPDSALSLFNTHANSEPFAAPPELAQVIDIARQVSEASGGAFDITVGPLVNAWGFGPPDTKGRTPTEEDIAALRERTGYQKVHVDLAASALSKERPDIYCDLSAIAKGYGVDKAAEALEKAGSANYMVEVGGEVRTKGVNAQNEPWRIAIEKPIADGRAAALIIPISGWSMATSGDYRNFLEKDGQRLSHEIDPATGRPISHTLASASVITETCVWADAYATALMVLGPEKGPAWAEQQGLAAVFIINDGKDFKRIESSHFTMRFGQKSIPAGK